MLQDKIFLHQCDIHRLPNAQEHQKQQGSHSRGRNEQALLNRVFYLWAHFLNAQGFYESSY